MAAGADAGQISEIFPISSVDYVSHRNVHDGVASHSYRVDQCYCGLGTLKLLNDARNLDGANELLEPHEFA